MNKLSLLFKSRRNLAKDERGEAVVSFALVLPLLLFLRFGILEFALAMVERHQASQALRILTRGVATTLTTSNLSGIGSDAETKCGLTKNGWDCTGGTITGWGNLSTSWSSAKSVLPRLTTANVELIVTPTSLADADADTGTMAMVTIRFKNLTYQSVVFSLYDQAMTGILFQDMSASLVLGG